MNGENVREMNERRRMKKTYEGMKRDDDKMQEDGLKGWRRPSTGDKMDAS